MRKLIYESVGGQLLDKLYKKSVGFNDETGFEELDSIFGFQLLLFNTESTNSLQLKL